MQRALLLAALVATSLALAAAPPGAVPYRVPEGSLRGYPVVVDPQTKQVLAQGTHVQWLEDGLLHVRAEFRFTDGRKVTEELALERGEALAQRSWRWREERDGTVTRAWDVDFATGRAEGRVVKDGKTKEWHETLELPRGASFAGAGFLFAVKNLVPRLRQGEAVELTAVGATPKPRTVKVRISHAGEQTLTLGGVRTQVDDFVIHPQVPGIARLFVKAPDTHLFFSRAAPTTFVRAVGPLVEPDDPVLETDVAPPAATGETR